MVWMGFVRLVVGGEVLWFRVRGVNSVGFRDRLSRARWDVNVFLSLVVVEPSLSATEWYERVPMVFKEKIVEAIEVYLEENHNIYI